MVCTKGPWLPWEDKEAVRAFFEGVREVAGRLGAHTLKIEPEVIEEQKDTKALLGEIGFQKARYDLNHKTTMILDLRPPEEELLARMKGKTRYNVRLAARKGVGVEETGFEEAWDTFYRLLEGTAERNGFAIRRSHEYLHDSMRAMYDAGQGRFFFAAYEGELLAAIFVFTFGERLVHPRRLEQREAQPHAYLPLAVGGNALGQRARDKVLRYGGRAPAPEPRRRRPLVERLPVQSELRRRSRGLPRLPRPTHQTGARRCMVQFRARVLPAVSEAKAERVLLEAVGF